MKTAHQRPQGGGEVIAGDALFRWNRLDVAQFTLVDPLAQGWSLVYVGASGGVPAHLALNAPGVWNDSTGPVYLLGPDMPSGDHDLIVTHDLVDPTAYDQEAGNLDRYVGSADYVTSAWDSVSSSAKLRTRAMIAGIASTVYSAGSYSMDAEALLRTTSTALDGLHGCGRGRVQGHGFCTAGPAALRTDPTVGFAVLHLTRSGAFGGETFRIFDVVVKQPGGA